MVMLIVDKNDLVIDSVDFSLAVREGGTLPGFLDAVQAVGAAVESEPADHQLPRAPH